MLDREACERRVYRLAALLTGNPLAATRVISEVVDAQPDLGRLDGAHMDRLTVLRSREIAPASLVSDQVPRGLSAALASLSPQQREVWVLVKVYRTPMRDTARAMDCSTTAAERHLHLAEAILRQTLDDDADQATRILLEYSQRLEVPAFFRAARSPRRRLRRLIITAALVAAAIAIAALAMWWTRPFDA